RALPKPRRAPRDDRSLHATARDLAPRAGREGEVVGCRSAAAATLRRCVSTSARIPRRRAWPRAGGPGCVAHLPEVGAPVATRMRVALIVGRLGGDGGTEGQAWHL